jgi:hypothetical protein
MCPSNPVGVKLGAGARRSTPPPLPAPPHPVVGPGRGRRRNKRCRSCLSSRCAMAGRTCLSAGRAAPRRATRRSSSTASPTSRRLATGTRTGSNLKARDQEVLDWRIRVSPRFDSTIQVAEKHHLRVTGSVLPQ